MQNEQKKRKEKEYISVGEASRVTGIESQTIRKLADKASFICYKTPSGQRKINLHSLQEFISNSTLNQKIQQDSKQNFLYARVSSRKQMDDLSRQVE